MESGKKKKAGKKPFRPCLKPRMLPGSVPKDQLVMDLRAYNAHRFRLSLAKAFVDSSPPHMNPYQYINLKKFFVDVNRLDEIEKANKQMICKINTINRTKGYVDCWNVYRPTYSGWEVQVKKLKKLVVNNSIMYDRLCATKPYYSREDHIKHWNYMLTRMAGFAMFPLILFDQKSVDQLVKEQPSISGGMNQYGPRPKVYMDFKIRNGICLGEIVIELYVEYAPKTVKNFLALCNSKNRLSYKHCRIHNALKGRYFETGDITKGNGKGSVCIYGEDFPEEESPLRHCRQGVVSTVRSKKKGKVPKSNSAFSITLSPVEELDGKRTVFGKVIRGNDVLCKINDVCKRLGTPLKTILIERCGEIPLTEKEIRNYSVLEKPTMADEFEIPA